MKLKPDDDIRNSEASMTITTCSKSELVKQIIAHSEMGLKDSQSSLEESASHTTTTTTTTNNERTEEVTNSCILENGTNQLPRKVDEDDDGADEDSVDVLVTGLKKCQIQPEVQKEADSVTKEISDGMVHLHLEDIDAKNEKKAGGFPRRQGPEEDDESEALESAGQKESKQAVDPQGKETKEEIKMVKLEAPCKEEEDEEEEEPKDTETYATLEERGPNGIPVYHNYQFAKQLPQTFNFGSQDVIPNGLCDQNSWQFLPNDGNSCMTNYNCQPQQSLQQMQGVSGGKRGINDLDFYVEAPKFFRPQIDPQLATMNGYNNLDAPGQPNKLKSINKVCHRQMSGGTVITNDSGRLEMNGTNLGSSLPPQQETDRLDSLELQEILNFHTLDSSANDGVFDIEELLEGSGQIQDSEGYTPHNDQTLFQPPQLQQQQQQNLQHYPPQQHQKQIFSQPVGQNLNMRSQTSHTYPSLPQAKMGVGLHNGCMKVPVTQAQMQFQLEQEMNSRMLLQNGLTSPGKVMTHVEDAGYISDMSPNHEAQFPPTPSPQSIMAASPDPASGSPPQQNWSPPPSNLSMFSQDSGVFSPNADFGEQQDEFVSTYVDKHLHDLEDALCVAEEDLRKKITLKDNSVQGGVSLNIPSTVPDDIMTSPSLQHSPEPSFKDAPSPAQTGKPIAAAARKTGPKKPALKAAEVRNSSGHVNDGSHLNKIIVSQPAVAKSPAGSLVISSPAVLTPNSPPLFNSQGKVAIPPSRQKPRVVQGTPVLPCVIMSNGITPVFVLPPEKPRYTAIAPKIASKPAEPQQAACATNVKATSPPAEGQNPKSKTTKRGVIVKDRLNIARRAVAAMPTRELIFVDHEGDTYLHVATVQTDECMIESLMERLVRDGLRHKVDAQNAMGQTPLFLAVCENKPEMVEVLVRFQADVQLFAEVTLDNGTREKSAAIHRASSKGEEYLRTLKELLKSSTIDLNQMDSEGHTALHCAILCHGKIGIDNKIINSIPIIETLIEAGADPNLQVQKNGKTGLMFALESRNIDLIESTFRMIDPVKLPAYLKTESFDGITCQKIASSIKSCLTAANQQRLSKCLKPPAASRLDH